MLSRPFKSAKSGDKTVFRPGPSNGTKNGTDSIVGDSHRFFDQIKRPFEHAMNSILRSWKRVKEELEDLRLWWIDPDSRSRKPHFRYPEKRSEMPPMEGLYLAQRSATMPLSRPSLSLQSPETSFYRESDSTSTPLLPFGNRKPSLQPLLYDPGFPDEAVLDQETIHRSTFDRRTSSQ